jgi:hypothetical protein
MKSKRDSDIESEKRQNELVEHTIKFCDLISDDLRSCPDNLILLTLTGHLIVEELMDMTLAFVLGLREFPKNDRGESLLSFYEKLRLIQAVVCEREPGPNADLLCVIKMLNKVRNALGHKLKKQAEIEEMIETLLKSYYQKTGKKRDPTKPLPTLLRHCLVNLCEFLIKLQRHFYNLENKL